MVDSSPYKIRIRYQGDLRNLAKIPGVKLVDRARMPILSSAEPLALTIGQTGATSPFDQLSGKGQIIAVADTGLNHGRDDDRMHDDFKGRIRALRSWPINPAWQEYVTHPQADDGPADTLSGHGTHVAGLALGNGTASGGKHTGVAPEASLVFQAIEQYTEIKPTKRAEISSGYYLNGRPLDLRDLFQEARKFGARIHVNAWGDIAAGQYTDDCFEADHFLFHHQDALLLFAAGNDGADRDGNRILDQSSLYAPASAKNVLTIGATEGGSTGVGKRAGWEEFDPLAKRFRNRVDRSDPVSGQPNRIALFSSTGPTSDGRIKPEVCAPGTNLAAPRSANTKAKGWGLADPLPLYMYYGGTSMAAGVAGGFAALVRQAWQEHQAGKPPSGMALKSLIILGAKPVINRLTETPEPNHVAGFGRIHLAASLPIQQGRRIILHDETEPGLFTGESREYGFSLADKGDCRAVLCWYDAPGESLINDLDLSLVDPSGEIIWGNHHLGTDGPDRINCCEVIDIPQLSSGKYTIQVFGANIPAGPQTYALVLSLPATEQLDLPVEYLKGVGPAYQQLLAKNDVRTIKQMLPMDLAALEKVLPIELFRLHQIFARLAMLKRVLAVALPPDIDPSLTLDELYLPAGPGDGACNSGSSFRHDLLALLMVFDRNKLSKIAVKELF